jgi:Zn-dependent protease with chaperone function
MNTTKRGHLCLLVTGALLALSIAAHAQLFERTDTQKELEMGREGARTLETHTPLSRNLAMQERVRRIGKLLVASLTSKAYPFEFKVLADPSFNACCYPGGFMYVNEGLLTRLPDDNEVAYVMAHEIGHAVKRHWANRMHKTSRDAIFGLLFDMVSHSNLGMDQVMLRSLHYSRENETEADKVGLEIVSAAGYDLAGPVHAYQVMEQIDKKNATPVYLRTHPLTKDRLKYIEVWLADMKQRVRPTSAEQANPPLKSSTGQRLTVILPTAVFAANAWFPLAVGNEWTYRVTGGSGKSTYSVSIAGAIAMENGTVYRRLIRLDKNIEIVNQVFTTESQVWQRLRPMDMNSGWLVEYAFSLEAGRTVQTDNNAFTLLSSENVNTPAGMFHDTLHLCKRTPRYTLDLWFGRGVGLLKSHCAETGVTEELTDYHVSKSQAITP